MNKDQAEDLLKIQWQWYHRLAELGKDYTDAVNRRRNLKAAAFQQHEKRSAALEALASSARYAEAKADLQAACLEIQAVSAMLQALDLGIRQSGGNSV